MEYLELCDDILKNWQNIRDFNFTSIRSGYPDIDSNIVHSAITTLKNDGYITPIINGFHFKISGEGAEFSKTGGYAGAKQRKEKEDEIKLKREAKQEQLTDLQIENMVEIVLNYPKTKRRAVWAIRISIGLLLLEVIKLLASLS